MHHSFWKPWLAEVIGTFGLTFAVAGALCADRYSGGQVGLVGVALAGGAAYAALATATRPISGGHLNPAVTVAAAVRGSLGAAPTAAYVAAQCAGATLAGFCLAGLYTPAVWEPVQLGTPTMSPEVAFSTGAFVEAVLTFLLVFVALQITGEGQPAAIVYGLAVGLMLAGGTLVAGTLTGAALNPARALGPALASGVWRDHAAYWIGPLSGGLVAALACRLLEPAQKG